MKQFPGVFQAQKKNGDLYYRSSITYQNRHISLGSFSDCIPAHDAYLTAKHLLQSDARLLPEDYPDTPLSFSKWVSLVNFKNNRIYIKTPIYLKEKYFEYYLSPEDVLLFSTDDLFYYSEHSIMRRGGHLFVADYGMQINVASRYGIKNFAVKNRDFCFVNGNSRDFRYENIRIINPYYGVSQIPDSFPHKYLTRIHVNGDHIVGRYTSETEAAIAYNKAADLLSAAGISTHYTKNYLPELSSEQYHALLEHTRLEPRFQAFVQDLLQTRRNNN